jgi:Sulfotransferase family
MTAYQLNSSAQQLLTKARDITGINIVDSGIEEVLGKFVQALNTEAQLSEGGVMRMGKHILLVLCNRLRMMRDFKSHPEIEAQKIERPIIMSGAARTGSTKLHKMLAATGDFNYLKCWEGVSLSLLSGNRDEDPAERICVADEHIKMFNDHAPKAKLIHEFSTFEPEEDNLMLAHRFLGQYMMAFVFVPEYIQWYMTTRDLREDYQFLKQAMQYHQWQFNDGNSKRWVLKNPTFTGFEPLVATVFPDAAFVATHRTPHHILPSGISLLHYYNQAYSDVSRKEQLGMMLYEGHAMTLQAQIAGRDADPKSDFLDIGYSETVNKAENAIEKIYAHAGMTLSVQARQRLHDWEKENRQHKLGVHSYTLEDFSITAEIVDAKYKFYIDRFGAIF